MSVYVDDPDFTLWHGDVRKVLPNLATESVDCVLTSPPFYALRDYGVEGQIGLEASPELWVAELLGVFRECRRVLRSSGTLWVECGDSYANPGGAGGSQSSTLDGRANLSTPAKPLARDLKPKDLLGQPWLLAFALRADGWWLRQCIIWAKPNAMPESVRDRCTTAHSYVFLLSKQARYWFDADAIAEPFADDRNGNPGAYNIAARKDSVDKLTRPSFGEWNQEGSVTGKNARSVWTIPTSGYSEAHFATWPEALVERIILAGCPEEGAVLDPFIGSGTTALVARRLGRSAVGVELNEAYCAMAARRTRQLSLLA